MSFALQPALRRFVVAIGLATMLTLASACQSVRGTTLCHLDGKSYAPGETGFGADYCNMCTCTARGLSCKVPYCATVPAAKMDKLDLLFVVDNAPHMAEKQALFAEAVPELLNELTRPPCLDDEGNATGDRADPTAPSGRECAVGTPLRDPVVDMHVGVLSSSLGGYGTEQCRDDVADSHNPHLNAHKNDAGRLLNRRGHKQTPVVGAVANYLAWFPPSPINKMAKMSEGGAHYQDLGAFVSDTIGLIEGLGTSGCPFASPLEAAYRFLVAPAPHDVTRWTNAPRAPETPALDETIIAQRAAFLRPDSTVMVVFVTDRDDASLDPWSVGGQGSMFLRSTFPTSADVPGAQRDPSRGGSTAPKATSSCFQDPTSSACTSCGFRANPAVQADPACRENEGFHEKDDDDLAVRFHNMKLRFGLDPRYPLKRYVDGFTKSQVPDLDTEHAPTGEYTGQAKCRNPLFAKDLPSTANGIRDEKLCTLAKGPRQPTDILVAVLGGVPYDLVHDRAPNEEEQRRLVGEDPFRYQSVGIDPRMWPSTLLRMGRPVAPSRSADRDFDTKKHELQYACTFPLPTPRRCDGNDESCPCDGASDIPICDGKIRTHGKATPSTRPIELALSLKGQASVSSICAPVTDPSARATDPDYGYRPMVRSIVDTIGRHVRR